jgi:hypothetical protein
LKRLSHLIFVLLATAGTAGVALAAERPFRPQLIEPANEIAVAAGSTATIVWDASATPENVEEWEAFVSIDGGKTYPVRITPHLDVAIRSFTWSVPPFPGAEGSILLRFGDEHEERRFTFACRFRITGALPISALNKTTARTAKRGEAAEPDGEGVLAWAEGPRDGSAVRQVAVDDDVLIAERQLSEPRERASGQLAGSIPGRFDQVGRRPNSSSDLLLPAGRASFAASRFLPPTDILLTTRRRNI